MFRKSSLFARVIQMGCCGCFGFSSSRKPRKLARPDAGVGNHVSQELLLNEELEEEDDCSYNGDVMDSGHGDDGEIKSPTKRSEEIILYRTQHGLICREFPVKETHKLIRSEGRLHEHFSETKRNSVYKDGPIEVKPILFAGMLPGFIYHVQILHGDTNKFWVHHQDENGNKMVNEYVREWKIGSGSYGKVVLYRSSIDGKHYAIKSFHKSHLLKLRVAPCETAMTDVLREVLIMKMLEHPNIVNLIEVIDDPTTDHFYMVLEYVEGKWVCDGSGPPGGLEENKAQKYFRDVVSGLMYLHAHNIVHGDIKPDNLLVTAAGTVKIGDFSVSQVFEDDNDELRRSPGTPVFTAPECCLGLTYRGKAADTWAVGVTLYCMVFGRYPFLGDTLQDTYDKIVINPLDLPDQMNPMLKNLIEGLLCKDPRERLTLEAVAEHPWFIGEEGPIPQYFCWCKRKKLQPNGSDGGIIDDLAHTYGTL